MTSETGSMKLRRRTTLVPVLIRGELAIGAQLRATKLVCGRSVWILTMMQSSHRRHSSGRRAHSLRRHCGHVVRRLPPPRIVYRQSALIRARAPSG